VGRERKGKGVARQRRRVTGRLSRDRAEGCKLQGRRIPRSHIQRRLSKFLQTWFAAVPPEGTIGPSRVEKKATDKETVGGRTRGQRMICLGRNWDAAWPWTEGKEGAESPDVYLQVLLTQGDTGKKNEDRERSGKTKRNRRKKEQ